MGQYYKPALIEDDGSVLYLSPHAYDNGMKLMEHSYIGNDFVNAVLSMIADHPMKVAWVGDYSDETYGDPYEEKIDRDDFARIYEAVWMDGQSGKKIRPDQIEFDFGSNGWYLVNHSLKSFLSLDKYIALNKWHESYSSCEYDCCIHPLCLLTACGNGRGGGDYHDMHPDFDKVGTWAFDLIEFTREVPADYAETMFHFTEQERV